MAGRRAESQFGERTVRLLVYPIVRQRAALEKIRVAECQD